MCHVLIIEDEPFIAMTIQDVLEEEGATSFDVAATQADAIAAALDHRPDLITSDVKLLEGTGPAAVVEIHRQLGDVPVIFISATPGECRPCDPPGVILSKPFRNRALTDAFHQMVVA
jgi:CheY-like chemotaxis protein